MTEEETAEKAEFNRQRLRVAASTTLGAVRGIARETSARATILEAFAEDTEQPEATRVDARTAAANLREAAALIQATEPLLENVRNQSISIFQILQQKQGTER